MSWQPHVTLATLVQRDDRFLMVRELIDSEVRINQPAGHLEAGETLAEAALRETLEETGWHVELTGVVGIDLYTSPANGVTYVRTTFIARPLSHNPDQLLDDGIIEAVWLNRDELEARREQLRSPLVLQVIDDYLAGRQFPLEVAAPRR